MRIFSSTNMSIKTYVSFGTIEKFATRTNTCKCDVIDFECVPVSKYTQSFRWLDKFQYISVMVDDYSCLFRFFLFFHWCYYYYYVIDDIQNRSEYVVRMIYLLLMLFLCDFERSWEVLSEKEIILLYFDN